MSVRVENVVPVRTIIHFRPEARGAIDAASAKALHADFIAFGADDSASAAVFWEEGAAVRAGWDMKHAAALSGAEALDPFDFPDQGEPHMAVIGPSRLRLSKPVIAAVAGLTVLGGMELTL